MSVSMKSYPIISLLISNGIFIILISFQQCEGLKFNQHGLFCTHPKRDPTFNIKWLYENTPPSGWAIITGNPIMRQHISQLLQGNNETTNDNYNKLCAKTVFSRAEKTIGGQFRGYDNLVAWRRCANNDGDLSCEFVSEANPDFKKVGKVYVSYFGERSHRNMQVFVYCFEDGDVGWTLSANHKYITETDVKAAVKHLEVIGFDTNDRVTLYEDSCEPKEKFSIWFPLIPTTGLGNEPASSSGPGHHHHGGHGWAWHK